MKKLYILLLIAFSHLSIPCHSDLAYVVNFLNNTVSVIDTATNTVIDTISGFSDPAFIAIAPNGKFALVTNNDVSGFVSVIDTATNMIIQNIPVGLVPLGVAITPDSQFAYVVNSGNPPNEVSVINMSDFSVQTVTVGANPYGIAITPNGQFAYVTNQVDGTVSIIRTIDNTVIPPSPIVVGIEPQQIAISLDGNFVYVANLTSNDVSVIRISDNTVVATLSLGGTNPGALGVRPNASAAYVAYLSGGNEAIGVINTLNNSLTPFSLAPNTEQGFAMAFNAAGTLLYLTTGISSFVQVIDTNTLTLITTIPVSGTAFGIALLGVPSLQNPPQNLQGKQLKNDFGLEYELFNLLQWQPSGTLNISGYHIYRDNRLIATVGPTTLQFQDHNRKKGVVYQYSVTAFSPSGESIPQTITVP